MSVQGHNYDPDVGCALLFGSDCVGFRCLANLVQGHNNYDAHACLYFFIWDSVEVTVNDCVGFS